MWIWASSQSTSSPSIQIFSVLVIGMRATPFLQQHGRRWRRRSERSTASLRPWVDGSGVVDGQAATALVMRRGHVGVAQEVEHHGRRR